MGPVIIDSRWLSKQTQIVELFRAYQPGYPSHCGYCHSADDSFIVEGMWAENMTVQDFQELVDRGFQRLGTTSDVTGWSRLFRISKQQKRVIRRFKEYLKTGNISGMPNEVDTQQTEAVNMLSLLVSSYHR